MIRKSLPPLYLLCAFLFVPVTLGITHLVTGEGLGDLLTSSSIIIIYYIPFLGILSAFAPHFSPRHAVYPLAGILLFELLSLVPGLAPLGLLGRAGHGYFPHANEEVLGKSLFLLLGALCASLSMLHRATLFRFLAAIMGFAQCAVIVLFHLVTVTWPFEGMLAQERQLAISAIETDGSMSRLCDLEGRSCYRGTPDVARAWVTSELRSPARALSLLDDTGGRDRLFHAWVENPAPDALKKVSIVTVHKHGRNDIALMVSEAGPTALYAELRAGLGVLIAVFHEVWISLGIAILARHGAYRFRRGRWMRDARPGKENA